MVVSTCELPPIDLQLPGASAVTGDIPIELPTSPPSLDVDNEQLTVWSRFTVLCPLADTFPLESEQFISPTTANQSL